MTMFEAYVLRPPVEHRFCLRSQLPLISKEAPLAWLDVAYEGEWHGHHTGSFELTRELFEQAIANFEAQVNAIKIDFDHETDFALPGTKVPARGFVHELEIRNDEDGLAHLFARVEFGPEATRINREEGGYRFSSAVFDFNGIDRKTKESVGLVLRRIALTDDPFIDGQEPLLLTRRGRTGEKMSKKTKPRRRTLSLRERRQILTLKPADAAHPKLEGLARNLSRCSLPPEKREAVLKKRWNELAVAGELDDRLMSA